MPLYKQLIQEMYETNQQLLKQFDGVHKNFSLNQKLNQEKFNQQGIKVKEIMQLYEKRLCGKSERSGMGVYSSKLADKYWAEIRKRFPLIDFVGVRIE